MQPLHTWSYLFHIICTRPLLHWYHKPRNRTAAESWPKHPQNTKYMRGKSPRGGPSGFGGESSTACPGRRIWASISLWRGVSNTSVGRAKLPQMYSRKLALAKQDIGEGQEAWNEETSKSKENLCTFRFTVHRSNHDQTYIYIYIHICFTWVRTCCPSNLWTTRKRLQPTREGKMHRNLPHVSAKLAIATDMVNVDFTPCNQVGTAFDRSGCCLAALRPCRGPLNLVHATPQAKDTPHCFFHAFHLDTSCGRDTTRVFTSVFSYW